MIIFTNIFEKKKLKKNFTKNELINFNLKFDFIIGLRKYIYLNLNYIKACNIEFILKLFRD